MSPKAHSIATVLSIVVPLSALVLLALLIANAWAERRANHRHAPLAATRHHGAKPTAGPRIRSTRKPHQPNFAEGKIMSKDTDISQYIIRHARPADIPVIRAMQERAMWVIGGDFYNSNEIANFLTMCGTMDDTVVEEGHYFVAEDFRSAILGSGGWSRSRPSYANATAVSEAAAGMPTVRSVFVDPAATRRGIASAIMLRTERDALEHDVDTLHLTATLSGFAFYEAFGYQTEEATELRFPDQSRFECVKMWKTLGKLRTLVA